MSEEVELLPCPFCGEPGWLQSKRIGEGIDRKWIIECVGCGIGTQYNDTADLARERWNARTFPSEADKEALASVRGAICNAVGLMGYLHWNSDPVGRKDKAEAYRQLSDALGPLAELIERMGQ